MFPSISNIPVSSTDPGTVELWRALPGRHQQQTVTVSAQLMNELHSAQSAIDFVKDQLTFGSDNQQSDFVRTGGESHRHGVAALHLRDTDFRGDNNALTKAAFQAQAGTCGEISAAVMAVLSTLDLDRPIFTYAAAGGLNHQFNVIGDIRQPGSAVVADGWPVFARSHLLDNALFVPDGAAILDVHNPKMRPKAELEDILSVSPLSEERITSINNSYKTPDVAKLNQLALTDDRLVQQLHGVKNLGVTYQNAENAQDLHLQTASVEHYNAHAQPMQHTPAKKPLAPYDE
ncbi:hypothetical protein [Erwinia sp. 9145]|uniref:hypothetical protein n=1 Tax=Erwinia sp. 9145 TaxID=1500895 RepID=UPI00055354A7|nr:hypothetical protein [Erwinia sp. 9145]